MTSTFEKLHKKITSISEVIPSFATEERKEIKKNNKLIDTYVDELTEISNILLKELKKRHHLLIPSKKETNSVDELNNIEELLKYLSPTSYLYKLSFDKNLYEIKYSNSLDSINANILDILTKFALVGINLTKSDFTYSLSVYKYMTSFLELKDNENFSILIKDTFESLYWECPSFVNHLYLSFVTLLDNYQDKFNAYIKDKVDNQEDYEITLTKYYQLTTEIEEENLTNSYLVYERFSNNELRIEDYLPDSVIKKDTISKYIDYEKYQSQTPEEKKHFDEQIANIYHDLCESIWLNKYLYLIKKTKELYLNKSNYTNDLKNFQKNIKTLNKQRLTINKKLFAIYNKYETKKSDRLLKKYTNLFNKSNNKIEEIITAYSNYDEIIFINELITKLDDDSTYFDVFKLFKYHYSYLLNFMKNESGDYQDYLNFVNNQNLTISKNIPFINEINIEDKLNEKYDLYDLEINLTDKDKLIVDLEYLIRLNLYEQHNLKLTDYKLSFDIKKIIGE